MAKTMPKRGILPQSLPVVVGNNIRTRRTQLTLTQTVLARTLGIEVETVSRYERGLIAPSFPQLERLCEVLKIPAWALFSDGSAVPDAEGSTLDRLLGELASDDRAFLLSFIRSYVEHHKRARETFAQQGEHTALEPPPQLDAGSGAA
jgi:transcriptional regulator with XRE-family HTH domain